MTTKCVVSLNWSSTALKEEYFQLFVIQWFYWLRLKLGHAIESVTQCQPVFPTNPCPGLKANLED